jgi:hypothetical protein
MGFFWPSNGSNQVPHLAPVAVVSSGGVSSKWREWLRREVRRTVVVIDVRFKAVTRSSVPTAS